MAASPTSRALPPWHDVLVVVAHPDDESFGLGAIIDAFVRARARVRVLCFTRGEASTLGGDLPDLAAVRERELREAGAELGIDDATLLAWPDGGLGEIPVADLGAVVLDHVAARHTDGLLAFDPSGVTGHPDHVAATHAAQHGAVAAGLPLLGWTLPAEVVATLNAEYGSALIGHEPAEIDVELAVDRTTQRRAVLAHATQAVPSSILWRRLELLGHREVLRRIVPAESGAATPD